MKSVLLITTGIFLNCISYAQADTISKKEIELLKLFGGIIKTVTAQALKENDMGNEKGGLVGGAIKNILKKTTEKSIRQLGVPGGFRKNPSTIIQLPEQLKKLENNFNQYGKKQLLDNLVQSMNETASDALASLAPMIAGKFVDMAVDRIIAGASADDSTLSHSFERLLKTDLKTEILPLAGKGLKLYKTAKTVSKIRRFVKKKKLGTLDLDITEHVTGKTIDGLVALMKTEELAIRNTPASLLDKLLDLLKN